VDGVRRLRDGEDVVLRYEPVEGDLHACLAVGLRDLVHHRVRRLYYGATLQRAVGYEAHTHPAAGGEQLHPGLLVDEAELDLIGDEAGVPEVGLGLLHELCAEVADPDEPGVALLDALLHGGHRLFQRNFGVWPVYEVEVDLVDAEALEAGLHGVEEVFPVKVIVPNLRGDEELTPVHALDGLADEFLGVPGAVVLGGVEVGQAEFDCHPYGGDCLRVPRLVGVLPAPHPPRPEAEYGYADAPR